MDSKKIIIDGDETKYEIYEDSTIINTKSGKVIKPTKNTHGYYQVHLSHNGHIHIYTVHKLVATYFIDNDDPIEKSQINHKNGIKSHNDCQNLEWITPSENQIHAVKTGLRTHKSMQRRLSEAERTRVYDLLENTSLSLSEIAHIIGTSISTISSIYTKKSYIHETLDMKFKNRSFISYNEGENNPNAEYDPVIIHKICKLLEDGALRYDIAKICNVPVNLIDRIKTGLAWTHISSLYKIPAVYKPLSNETISQIKMMIDKDFSTADIIKKLNLEKNNTTYNAISYYRRAAK